MSSINNISLYIPRVFANIIKEDVVNVFEKLLIGKVSNIDFVIKICDQIQYNAIYIHFEYWYDNTAARNFQERVLNPDKEARIVYDDPWFWVVLENKATKHVSGDRKPRIVLDLQEDEACAIPAIQMTNKDFSDLFKKKPTNTQISDLINSAIIPKLIRSTNNEFYRNEFENDEDNMDEIEFYMDNIEEEDEDEDILNEIEALMEDQENEHLISIDGRYVQELERENKKLRESVLRLQIYIENR